MECTCGSDYFAMSSILQTSKDGRANLMADDVLRPWVMHLTCASCGNAYVCDPRSKVIHLRGSVAAMELLGKYRLDFSASFDPRQKENSVASVG